MITGNTQNWERYIQEIVIVQFQVPWREPEHLHCWKNLAKNCYISSKTYAVLTSCPYQVMIKGKISFNYPISTYISRVSYYTQLLVGGTLLSH